MDMSKYKGMFLSEAGEHLKSMGRLVVTLEDDPGNRSTIDTLFRNAHSIKGMAASMGYEQTTRLAHHLEDFLDAFRKTGQVPAAAVDRLLAGIDLLEGLLEDIAAELPERATEAFIAAAPQPASPSAPVKPQAAESVAASAAREDLDFDFDPEGDVGGAAPRDSVSTPTPAAAGESPAGADERVLDIRIDLSPEAAAPAARAILIFRDFERQGELLHRVPSAEELVSGTPIRHLQAHLRTGRSAAELEAFLAALPDVHRVAILPLGAAAGSAPGAAPQRDEPARTVRVRTDLLDRFINLTGELLTTRYMLQAATKERRWREVQTGVNQLARLIADLHHHVLQVRMLPLESITGRLPRLIRELARTTGKEVKLRLEGEGIELDRTILEMLADPLMHMVRNAVDHGIDQKGTVTVRAWREKDLVILSVADDGWGMDPEVIRRKALEKGLITTAQARSMRDRDVYQLVCIPGFSTRTQITETSGRGVGMDVVKSAVESLGGTLLIESEKGNGTRFLLKLPLSVAIIQVLLVEVGGQLLGLPVTRVIHSLEVSRQEVRSSGKQLVVSFDDELVPLVSLAKLLGLPAPPRIGTMPVVVTEYHGRKLGLVVDRLVGQREAFVKTLQFPLDHLQGVSGATFLGDGSIVFIIDPQGLMEGRTSQQLTAASGAKE